MPLEWAKDAERNVKKLGVKHSHFRIIEGMGHGAEMEELDSIINFIKDRV